MMLCEYQLAAELDEMLWTNSIGPITMEFPKATCQTTTDSFASLESSKPQIFTEGPYGVHDTLRCGPRYAVHDLAPRHPLQRAALQDDFSNEASIKVGKTVLGSHIVVRHEAEKLIMRSHGRLGHLPSSGLSLEILNHGLDSIQTRDFLNVTNSTFSPSAWDSSSFY